MGDPLRLRQVFVNIMSNAVKYTPAGGRIYIDVWQEDGLKLGYGSFIFRCADTGIGMSADKLFLLRKELDSKAGEFSKEVSGTGLKNINDRIRLYYGERYGMVIDSKEGKGTTVALLLPADG